MLEKISQLKQQAFDELDSLSKSNLSLENSEELLQNLRVKFLGKKGLLTGLLKDLGSLDASLRPQVGQATNDFKKSFEDKVVSLLQQIKDQALELALKNEKIDISLPGKSLQIGSLHPVTLVLNQISDFFLKMGFDVHGGPEIESDFYNFEALGLPPNHPARDMQDTFYIWGGRDESRCHSGLDPESSQGIHFNTSKNGHEDPDLRQDDRLLFSTLLLRTHTSPVQVRVMEKQNPPIRMIAPGVVYRRDSDLSHTPMFHQVEGLVVDEQISFSDLKGVLDLFLKELFGADLKLRFRPSFFPFTEPSAEVDISCVLCKGAGCRVCKNTGWIEIMGCGMVDPVVFSHVNIDSEKYNGFAFGLGVERVAMLKYGIDDLRAFFESDLRFLKQF